MKIIISSILFSLLVQCDVSHEEPQEEQAKPTLCSVCSLQLVYCSEEDSGRYVWLSTQCEGPVSRDKNGNLFCYDMNYVHYCGEVCPNTFMCE